MPCSRHPLWRGLSPPPTHARVRIFKAEELNPMATRFTEGEKIDVGFDGKKCIHSRNCVLGHPGVLEPKYPRKWKHHEAGSVE